VRQENVFEENFKIKNQEYTLLTFNKESAPNLREAIAISDRRNERMLTVEEAIMIIADYESKTALSAILHADQRVTWSYLYTGNIQPYCG
jgi:hypothetical protein